MFKSKRIHSFPSSDRFQFLRLMKSVKDLALTRNDTRLANSANECLRRSTEGHESCPLRRIFLEDYVNTELPPGFAFLRPEGLESNDSAGPCELLERLLSQVKLQATACDDSKYFESVLACESFIKSGDHACPFSWIKGKGLDFEHTNGSGSSLR